MKTQKQKLNKFTKLALQEIKNAEIVSSWTYKELADHLIQTSWAKEKFGSLNIAVLDRVITFLNEVDEFTKERDKNEPTETKD
jgi:hypothetical protein